jgi:penicillin-insensitive murein endopeptidase
MVRAFLLILLSLGLAACSGAREDESGAAADASLTFASANYDPQAIAKQLFGRVKAGSAQPPEPFGGYAGGCVAGAVQLPETGPTWQAMRLSRNRNWAHPDTIAFVKRLSEAAAAQPGWEGIYVGDMSQPRGGPMLTGHSSHQSGLDADIWMLPPKRLNLTRAERENISSITMQAQRGAVVNSSWTPQHMAVLKAAASDPAVARIFLFPGAKVQMCKDATGDRSWLRKIRPWYGHHYHFHVRLSCPPGAKACVDQAPPPPGDGCAEAEEWVRNILNPPPPDPNVPPPRPKRETVLADLPAQCASVLSSQ